MNSGLLSRIRNDDTKKQPVQQEVWNDFSLFTFDDFINFLHDLNLLYEFTRLVFDSKYEGYKFTSASLRRDPWGLARADRLSLYRITQESPITMILLLGAVPGAATTIWVLNQIIDKIYNFRLDHQIRMLQRDKLMQELETTPVPPPFPDRPHPQSPFYTWHNGLGDVRAE